jgi:hypothetical protein
MWHMSAVNRSSPLTHKTCGRCNLSQDILLRTRRISYLAWNLTLQCRAHESQKLVHTLSQINLVHAIPPYFFKISILILSHYLALGLNSIHLSGLATIILPAFLSSPCVCLFHPCHPSASPPQNAVSQHYTHITHILVTQLFLNTCNPLPHSQLPSPSFCVMQFSHLYKSGVYNSQHARLYYAARGHIFKSRTYSRTRL